MLKQRDIIGHGVPAVLTILAQRQKNGDATRQGDRATGRKEIGNVFHGFLPIIEIVPGGRGIQA
jgi:hypothetical protein